jgi:hypothetical protein
MRTYQTLSTLQHDAATGIVHINADDDSAARISMRREGEYIAISASHGPIEIALRLRLADLTRGLTHLQPVDGLQASRQVGSGDAFIGMGLQTDGTLLMRPTITADATGYLCFNLAITPAARAELYTWLAIDNRQ